MKRSLRGSRQQPLPDMNNLNQTAQNIDPAMLNDVQSVVDKYGGKSEQELIGELAAAKRCMHSPVAITAVIAVEDFR